MTKIGGNPEQMQRITALEAPTLGDFLADIVQARRFIALGMLAGLLIAALFTALATAFYRAEMTIAPATPLNGAQFSPVTAEGNFSALNYVLQHMSAGSAPEFIRFETVYAGPSVAALLLEDPKILKGLRYERTFKRLRRNQNWSPEKLSDYIARRVKIVPVGSTSLRKMRYLHPDRRFASYFLRRTHALTDGLIRQRLKAEAQERAAYLREALQKASHPEHKRALTGLLLEQERLLMLVSIDQPFAASLVEPPSSSLKPAWPDKLLVFPAFVFAGGMIGFILHGFRTGLRATRRGGRIESAENAQPAKEKEPPEEDTGEILSTWYRLGEHENANQRPVSRTMPSRKSSKRAG